MFPIMFIRNLNDDGFNRFVVVVVSFSPLIFLKLIIWKLFLGRLPSPLSHLIQKKTLRNSIHKSTTNRKNNLVKFYPHRSLIRFQTSVFLWWWCWILIWTIMILLFSAIFLKDIGLEEAVFVIISYDRLFFMYNNILYWLNLYNLLIGVPNRQKFNKFFPVN
jgi:hypothetical protein